MRRYRLLILPLPALVGASFLGLTRSGRSLTPDSGALATLKTLTLQRRRICRRMPSQVCLLLQTYQLDSRGHNELFLQCQSLDQKRKGRTTQTKRQTMDNHALVAQNSSTFLATMRCAKSAMRSSQMTRRPTNAVSVANADIANASRPVGIDAKMRNWEGALDAILDALTSNS